MDAREKTKRNASKPTDGTHLKLVVPWLAWNVFPNRTPLTDMKAKVLIVMRASEPSAANQELPGPSAPAGQRMLAMSLKPDVDDDGAPWTWEPVRGMGTREEEKGVAPAEKGTLGLLVPLRIRLLPKDVTKEPAKNRLSSASLVEMETTFA